jgi:hypothetical protein
LAETAAALVACPDPMSADLALVSQLL